jgi:hypothetical protein
MGDPDSLHVQTEHPEWREAAFRPRDYIEGRRSGPPKSSVSSVVFEKGLWADDCSCGWGPEALFKDNEDFPLNLPSLRLQRAFHLARKSRPLPTTLQSTFVSFWRSHFLGCWKTSPRPEGCPASGTGDSASHHPGLLLLAAPGPPTRAAIWKPGGCHPFAT